MHSLAACRRSVLFRRVGLRKEATNSTSRKHRCLSSYVVHRIGDDYQAREYLLLPSEENASNPKESAIASLRTHRNIIFGARLLLKNENDRSPLDEKEDPMTQDTTLPQAGSLRLQDVASPLVEAALTDCSMEGEQVQAMAALYGLSSWVVEHWADLAPHCHPDDSIGQEAAYAIATGIPRAGHSVVGQGTFRDGQTVWKAMARQYAETELADEAQLYAHHSAQLMDIEHLADTSPAYLKSAGGAMARFLFL